MKRIVFGDEMMRAIADGRKTMTRRPCKMTNVVHHAGDLVAATCAFWPNDSGENFTGADYRFEHPDWESDFGNARPARIMPAAFAPFVLRITEMRAEKLGTIQWHDDDDARREGFENSHAFAMYWDHLYGSGAFDRDSDSWVWVYGFEIAERRISCASSL